jgi:hypothetical protein
VNGFLYIADSGNNVVRRVDLSTGIISAFAGNHTATYAGDGGPATSASLNGPWGVTVGPDGQIYIADQNNHSIRKVALDGTITTIAGNGTSGFSGDGGPASTAVLDSPSATAIDAAGNIYISDAGNNRVRKVNPVTGEIDTVVGSDLESFSGDGGPAKRSGDVWTLWNGAGWNRQSLRQRRFSQSDTPGPKYQCSIELSDDSSAARLGHRR